MIKKGMVVALSWIFLGIVVCGLLLFIFVAHYKLSIVVVHGDSMVPTLAHGDRVLIWKHRASKQLQKDLIVVGKLTAVSPHFATMPDSLFIKRVVGLAGETITIPIADLPQEIRPFHNKKVNTEGNLVWEIPPNHCFVRGDGRFSDDSVNWGPIPTAALIGVVLLKLPRRVDLPPPTFPVPENLPAFSDEDMAEWLKN